jgi:hypothetical protein
MLFQAPLPSVLVDHIELGDPHEREAGQIFPLVDVEHLVVQLKVGEEWCQFWRCSGRI